MPQFDIHYQALPAEEQRATYKFVSWGYNPTIGVRGFQMLVNQWLLCFLTPRGSDPTDLTRGTEFTKLVGSNLSLQDARDVALIAVDDCNEQIAQAQARDTTLTPTERLNSATVVDFVADPTAPGFSLYVELRNQANERLIVNLPTAAVTE